MRRSWVLAFALVAASGCNCFDRRIDVSLPATAAIAGQAAPLTFTGGVSDSNIGGSYMLLERVVSDASSSTEAHTIVWTLMESGAASPGFLAFTLRVPVAPGDSASVSLSSRGGGWGVLSGDTRTVPLTATAYLERDGFVPATARGTLSVLRSSPLQLGVDVTFFGGSGDTVRVQGTMNFAVTEVRTACFE
jgi:hypothetical protein